MRFVADLHIHSRHSRATSRDLDLPHLHAEAQRKGVTVVGTGDFTHPGWFRELQEQLVPAEEGLYRLRADLARAAEAEVPLACRRPVRFMLTVEISNIYKRGEAVRKVHNLIFVPDLEAAARLRAFLERVGNLASDGRPILGLDSRDLLAIAREAHERTVFVPAHIWTPWFSVLGAKSGFDSIEEAFGDLTPEIFAIETGLSSDPPMNWRISALDRFTLVSNSDAHSPAKLGREANLFDLELSYDAIRDALRTGDPARFLGTVEFFPEEGKYHLDGCRRCALRCLPRETREHGGRCPSCGKPITVGVLHRVDALADRAEGYRPEGAPPFRSLIPLGEILAEVHGVGAGTRTVARATETLIGALGPELEILRDVPLEEIERQGGSLMVEAIRRVRAGEIEIAPGYDGEFGTVRIFREDERDRIAGQDALFASHLAAGAPAGEAQGRRGTLARAETSPHGADVRRVAEERSPGSGYGSALVDAALPLFATTGTEGLNPEQRRAVQHGRGALLVLAGPGTGKTRVLVHRIAWLVTSLGVDPASILAVTFTNRATDEMRERLAALLSPERASRVTVRTLHAHGRAILEAEAAALAFPQPVTVIGEGERLSRIEAIVGRALAERVARGIERLKSASLTGATAEDPQILTAWTAYDAALRAEGRVDFDDLIRLPREFLERQPDRAGRWHEAFPWVLVDEFQDLDGAQYALLRQIAPPGSSVTVVGDPDQAIYGFRGASPEFVNRFREEYGPEIVRLTRNYRSTPTILRAAHRVIASGDDVRPLAAVVEGGLRVVLLEAPTAAAEAEAVVHEIERLVGGTSLYSMDSGRVDREEPEVRGFSEIAVLFRIRQAALPLVEALDRSGIPYQQAEARPLLADPVVAAIAEGMHRAGALGSAAGVALDAAVEALVARAPAGTLRDPGDRQTGVGAEEPGGPGGEHEADVDGDRVEPDPQRWTEEIRRVAARLAPIARRASDVTSFLADLALRSDPDLLDPRAERVALLTLHAAKGLEFPVVFIIGCEDGLLPYRPPSGETAPPDEERRLLYVGMTRARRILILSRARRRSLFGRTGEAAPSPFLAAIEESLVRREAVTPAGPRAETLQLRLF
ncbi:MAG: UvrD-helicase domain-containing protein [Gemmatimonadetes bacterium]|nr:UvrD-helicase domain-containing protein [Gemmatimonadota bacterium]